MACAPVACAAESSTAADKPAKFPSQPDEAPSAPLEGPSLAESIFGDPMAATENAEFADPASARFDQWQPLADEGLCGDDVRPFDWMRKWGFHHSSTEGRSLDRGLPMERASWLNRPYHIDWFAGPLLGDELAGNSVEQQSTLIAGLRAGWDFDYFWGVEWRFAWADPDLNSTQFTGLSQGNYFASDIDLVYYPWGDTKVRPFFQLGMGVVEVDTIRGDGAPETATLLSMPFGGGVQFPLTRWAAMRLEILDAWAFGGDGVDTLSNFSFTAGMEFRLGARPNSYWPWRTSRNVW